jgi:hypothetical protein
MGTALADIPAQRARSSFQPDLSLPGGNSFVRLVTAQVIAQVQGRRVVDVVAERYPSDRVTRAAATPAMTSVAGWAAELAQRMVADNLKALGPASAAAEIFRNSLVLNFDGFGSISAPGFVAEFGNAGFVAEGQPIPVRQLAASPALLSPHKLAVIAVLTREMIESSNAEALVEDTLTRAAGRMLDEVLFDANPGDAARPPGLRSGIAASTPSSNTSTSEAFYEDMAVLFNELAPVAGNGPYILVMSPGRAMMFNARNSGVPTGTNVIVLGSSAVINDVLAIAPAALVAAFSPQPEIETSKAATLVMDTAPGAAGTMGPERSMFQTDTQAIKLRWPVTWALRDPRGFAWITPSWK